VEADTLLKNSIHYLGYAGNDHSDEVSEPAVLDKPLLDRTEPKLTEAVEVGHHDLIAGYLFRPFQARYRSRPYRTSDFRPGWSEGAEEVDGIGVEGRSDDAPAGGG